MHHLLYYTYFFKLQVFFSPNATVYELFQQHCLHEVNKLPFYFIPELEYATYDIMKIMKASVSHMVNVTLPSGLDCIWYLTSD